MNIAAIASSIETVLAMVPGHMKEELGNLVESKIREAADDAIDFVENHVQTSATKVDDALVLPVLRELRERAGIPDDIGGDED